MQRLSKVPSDQKSLEEEQEIAQLFGIRISSHFRTLLLMIYENPLASYDELALFLSLSPATIKRSIYILHKWGCVHSVAFQSTRKYPHMEAGKESNETKEELRWKLSERGLRYVAASQQVSCAQVLKTHWRLPEGHGRSLADGRKAGSELLMLFPRELPTNGEPASRQEEPRLPRLKESLGMWQPGVYDLQKNLEHTASIYGLVAAFHKALALCPELVLAWFETGIRSCRRYQSRAENRSKIRHLFCPDATLSYSVRDDKNGERRHFIAWLWWSDANMSTASLQEKVMMQAYYLRSRGWRREGKGILPFLIIVVPDAHQFDRMTAVAQEALSETDLHVCITMQDLLISYGFLGKIWQLIVPLPIVRQTTLHSFLEMMNEGEVWP